MNTLPATWNRAIVRATRFLRMNITTRRRTCEVRANLLKSGLASKYNPQNSALMLSKCVYVRTGSQTYREYGCGYCTAKQGLDVIGHHFFSKNGHGVIIQRLFVVHIKPPENCSSAWEMSQQRGSACRHKTIKRDATFHGTVTDGAEDDQNGQNPHQHLGDVTDHDHHDQGQNWKEKIKCFQNHNV